MNTWAEANRLANLAAAQAHGDLEIDTAVVSVDVYGAIGEAGVVLIWRPMPRQFGAYINEPGSLPGILINKGLPHAAQRHTAAHELGHFRMGHGTRTDADLDPPDGHRAGWTPEEKAAEAFAAWFLMPRKTVRLALMRLGIERPRTPEDVYRLSLLLGTPYRAAVRHLPSLRLASQGQAQKWAAVPPNAIKQRLDPAATPASRKPDVWLVEPNFAGSQFTVHPGDRIVITDPHGESHLMTCPEGLKKLSIKSQTSRKRAEDEPEVSTQGHPTVLEVEERSSGAHIQIMVALSAPSADYATQWEFGIQVEGKRSGVARRWFS